MAFTCAECHDKSKCKYHTPPTYPMGEHPSWPGVKVYLPAIFTNISVGRCEDCKKTRPCVDC
jgi:hypothetical protein